MSNWQPIETAPFNEKSDYFFCLIAWGPDADKSTGDGMRYKDKWYAAGLFYRSMSRDERQYSFRDHEVTPSHWMPRPKFENQQEEE
jgi:hypothetical protein